MFIALSLLGGLVFLTLGAEGLVRGGVAIAKRAGVSPLMIGLTLVGFGTSTPELVASLQAAAAGSPAIAIGNVVGSNIFNIIGILGIAAIISTIHVSRDTWRRDGMIMIAATLLVMTAFHYLGELPRWLGIIGVALLLLYVVYVYYQERGHKHTLDPEHAAAAKMPPILAGVFVLGGLVGLMLGANLLVSAAIDLARMFGLSETVIGLTIVAIGTSLPELATSVVAALKKHADIAVGNIIGSNIFNILGILGVTAIVKPIPVPPQIIHFDMWVMLAAAVALMVYARAGYTLTRPVGVIFLAGFLVYTWQLILWA
jgi:cation:H+ antiporter